MRPNQVADEALCLMKDFQTCQTPGFDRPNKNLYWQAPTEGTLKLNEDVAIFDSQNKVGVGCVPRDARGRWP